MYASKGRQIFCVISVGFIIAALFLWQTTDVMMPRILGVKAAPLIPAVIYIGMRWQWAGGLIAGLICGILMDITSVVADGFNAVVLTTIGFLCGTLITYLFNDNIQVALLFGFVGCAFYYIAYWVVFFAPSETSGAYSHLIRYTLTEIAYTFIITLPLYFIFGYIKRHFS